MCKIRKLFATRLTYFFPTLFLFRWVNAIFLGQKKNTLMCKSEIRFDVSCGFFTRGNLWICKGVLDLYIFSGDIHINVYGKFSCTGSVSNLRHFNGKTKEKQKGSWTKNFLITSLNVCLISFKLAVCPVVFYPPKYTHTHSILFVLNDCHSKYPLNHPLFCHH